MRRFSLYPLPLVLLLTLFIHSPFPSEGMSSIESTDRTTFADTLNYRYKHSGIGRELGSAGVHEYCSTFSLLWTLRNLAYHPSFRSLLSRQGGPAQHQRGDRLARLSGATEMEEKLETPRFGIKRAVQKSVTHFSKTPGAELSVSEA